MNEHGVNELRTGGGTWTHTLEDAISFIEECVTEDKYFDAAINDANGKPVRIYYCGVWFVPAQETTK